MGRRSTGIVVVLLAAVVGLGLSAWLGGLSGGSDGGGAGDAGGGLDALAAAAPATGGSTDFDPGAASSAPGRDAAIVARGKRAAVAVYARPVQRGGARGGASARGGDGARGSGGSSPRTIKRRTVDGKPLPVIFRVLRQRDDGWLRVELPTRPAKGAHGRGWVRAADVRLARSEYRIVIERGTHRLLLREHGRTVMRAPIAVGRSLSPTPTGSYFVTDLLRPPDPRGFYGPYALGLSAYSPVYTSFAGGDGQVGIHGTDDPSVLGSDVSHGCIRISNAVVTKLARTVPLGTPVTIRA